eukprot:TRINITY_DN69804_c0_g1_i1.p1 TRINITY_DN69804_c0_g1~~TRINITY_DN69804_c0_g1_i1.p1  ORF type:complete len:720 (-),score=67.83 TRINITY_DN69804_c0_g1_i1:288-2447(-)
MICPCFSCPSRRDERRLEVMVDRANVLIEEHSHFQLACDFPFIQADAVYSTNPRRACDDFDEVVYVPSRPEHGPCTALGAERSSCALTLENQFSDQTSFDLLDAVALEHDIGEGVVPGRSKGLSEKACPCRSTESATSTSVHERRQKTSFGSESFGAAGMSRSERDVHVLDEVGNLDCLAILTDEQTPGSSTGNSHASMGHICQAILQFEPTREPSRRMNRKIRRSVNRRMTTVQKCLSFFGERSLAVHCKTSIGNAAERGKSRVKKAVLPNKTKVKEALRKTIMKPQYNVASHYWDHGACQKIARNSIFENITLAVILLNTLWLSIDMSYNTSTIQNDALPIFIIMDNVFVFYFSFEWSVRFGAFQSKLNALRDAWFVFDTAMVALMVFETWIMFIFVEVSSFKTMFRADTAIFGVIRLLRLSRLARLAYIFRRVPELIILVKGVGAAMRSVVWSFVLLLLVLYVFAVLFNSLTQDTPHLKTTYFSTVPKGMHALAVYGVIGDCFSSMGRDFAADDTHPYMLLNSFYLFVLLCKCTIMNMLIGIVCEVMSSIAEMEHEALALAHMSGTFRDIVDNSSVHSKTFETDAGTEVRTIITELDFLAMLEQKDTALFLEEAQVEVLPLVDIVDTIFSRPGYEDGWELGDFVMVLLNHRKTKKASILELTAIRHDFSSEFDMANDRLVRLQYLEKEMSCDLISNLDAMCDMFSEALETCSPVDT